MTISGWGRAAAARPRVPRSPSPTLEVAYPWYRQTWAHALLVGLLALVAWGIHRARTAVQLRLANQRTRIAMDLHDELGAGLGSIRILAGLASDQARASGGDPALTARVEEISAELGAGLTDIVWSLRESSSTLDALARYAADRGRDLLASHGLAFRTRFPVELPRAPMSPAVSRNTQLILVEALHNAARHSRCTEVELVLERTSGRWCFEVSDDGVGLANAPASTRPGGGSGLRAMRARADAIGAELELERRIPTGTRVRIRLPRRLDG